jgi:cell wall-associated NlpC family hydrolase
LATQAIAGRHLHLTDTTTSPTAIAVRLCEDNYPGWLAVEDLQHLTPASEPYRAIALTDAEIRDRMPQVIVFAQAALKTPNTYLWGGTTGPNFDCSGLMQTAFASAGIWLPRDAYQQEAFLQPIEQSSVQPGDLVFFGTRDRCTHVGLCLDADQYLHSSGKDIGRNGIGIDRLSHPRDEVGDRYFQLLRGFGRVVASYKPE